jgi:transcriptional regulator with XRE-family HTH domain
MSITHNRSRGSQRFFGGFYHALHGYPRTAFGERLFAARTAAGLSQVEVAQKLGITQTAYALWERRPMALRPDQIEKIAKILRISVEDLFTSNGRSKERTGPVGRARRAFERVSQLPRSQQQYILQVVEAFVEAKNGSAK